MSFAYPEGECFFKRSTPDHFSGHVLVEYIWNRPPFHGSDTDCRKGAHFHPRSAYKVVKGDWWDTYYGNWTSIFLLYGKKPYSDAGRGNRFREQEKGAALESCFMTLPMPLLAKAKEWFLSDRTACLRGIYIPLVQQASRDYPEICTYLQLDPTLALAPDGMWTMAINIHQPVNLISLPHQLRGRNFLSYIIRMVDRKLAPAKGAAQVARQTSWLAGFIKNSLAIGSIPIVGPLAGTAIADPGAFESTLRELIRVADLAMKVAEEARKITEEQVPYLSKQWPGQTGKPAAKKVKEFESIRNFKYWNVMKAAPAAAPPTAQTAAASRVILRQHSKPSSTTGQADKVYGGIVKELRPEVSDQENKEMGLVWIAWWNIYTLSFMENLVMEK
ncbi:hypothetical protein BDV06DRAFT_215669 [Aspergillus oleicola]